MPEWNLNALGPRQRTPIARALNELDRLSRTHIEITGLKSEPGHRFEIYNPLGSTTPNPAFLEAWNSLGERHSWTVTPSTRPTLLADIAAATSSVRASLPVLDKRRDAPAFAPPLDPHHAARTGVYSKIREDAPPRAARAIFAELVEDESDSLSDYHGSTIVRRVFLDYGTTSRESFPALRRAAALFPETEHLGPGKGLFHVGPHVFALRESAAARAQKENLPLRETPLEHRENYSMGAGNYLKAGHRHSSGWQVCSYPLSHLPSYGPVPETLTAPSAPPPYRATTAHHSAKDIDIYLATPIPRLPRVFFDSLRDAAKGFNGWYARPFKGNPHGFAFSTTTDRDAFAAAHLGPRED